MPERVFKKLSLLDGFLPIWVFVAIAVCIFGISSDGAFAAALDLLPRNQS